MRKPLLVLAALCLAACADDASAPTDTNTVDTTGADTSGPPSDTQIDQDTKGPDGVVDRSDEVFDPDHLVTVEITLAPEDWDALRKQSRSFGDILAGACLDEPFAKIFTWFPASVTVDGETYAEIAVRKKGFFGSLSEVKPSLKLKFDASLPDQRHLGMKRMTLNNSRQDPSHLNTCLTYKIYRDAGYVAPRCNFARVTVNGNYLGVYVHVESIKKPFLRRHFSDDDGNLYEGTLSDFNPVFRGTIEKKTNEKEAEWSDIDAAVAALETPGDAGLTAIDEVFDVDRFMSFWALEVLVGHWDGYTGNRNNFYFYVDPADGKIVFIPWGPDAAFAPVDHPFDNHTYPASVMANSTLARRLYADPALRKTYQDRLTSIVETTWDEAALGAEVDRIEALIGPHIPEDVKELFTQGLERVRAFITTRREAILADIKRNPDWSIEEKGKPCLGPRGAIDVSFTTTWGSLANSLQGWTVGDVDFKNFTLNDEALAFPNTGALVGIETQGPAAGNFLLALMSMGDDGNLYILAFVMDPGLPQAGEPLVVGDQATGHWLRLAPPYSGQLEPIGFLSDGMLIFDVLDKTPDGVVSGSVQATIF